METMRKSLSRGCSSKRRIIVFSVLAALLCAVGIWRAAFAFVPSAHAMTGLPLGGPCANGFNTGASCAGAPQPLSARERAYLNAKQALAHEYALVRAGKLSHTTFQRDQQAFAQQYGLHPAVPAGCPSTPGQYVICGANSVYLAQQPQTTSYYCGPATAEEVLGTRGYSSSQSTLAGNSYLKTNYYGETPWSGPRVMGPTLNNLLNTGWYIPVDGLGVSGGFTTSTWESDLTFDVDNGWAIAGNVYEYAGGVHLPGHPVNQNIGHWIGIKGYTNYGADTTYADSVYNAPTVWFYRSVTSPYSTISSSDMTTLLNGRGYVW